MLIRAGKEAIRAEKIFFMMPDDHLSNFEVQRYQNEHQCAQQQERM